MPSKGGMTINGIPEECYVYRDKTVEKGDFVETIQGVKEIINDKPTSVTVPYELSYGTLTIESLIKLTDSAFFVCCYCDQYSSTTKKYALITIENGTSKCTYSGNFYMSTKYYDDTNYLNSHNILRHYHTSSKHYFVVTHFDDAYTTITETQTWSVDSNDSSGQYVDYYYFPLTEDTGVMVYHYLSGSTDILYYCFISIASNGTVSVGTSKTMYYTGTTNTVSLALGYGSDTFNYKEIAPGKFLNGANLFTIDTNTKTMSYDQLKISSDSETFTYTSNNWDLVSNNMAICTSVSGSASSVTYYLVKIDIENLTYTLIDSVTVTDEIRAYVKVCERYYLCLERYNPNNTANTTYRSYVIEAKDNKLVKYDFVQSFGFSTIPSLQYYQEGVTAYTVYNTLNFWGNTIPEMQVQKTTVESNSFGVANTSGIGGTETEHNEYVEVIIPNLE